MKCLSVAMVAVVLGLSGFAHAETTSLTPVQDTGVIFAHWTTGYETNANYGGDQQALHHWASSPSYGTNAWSYYQFDLASLGISADDVLGASLRLTHHIDDGYGWYPNQFYHMQLHNVTSAWQENTLSRSLMPTEGGLVAEDTFVADGTGARKLLRVVTLDVTSLVKDWLDGSAANFGVKYSQANEFIPNGVHNIVYTSEYADNVEFQPTLTLETATSMPTPSAIAAGLSLLSVFGLRWRRTR